MKHEVAAIKHKDVRGKEQLYLKIGNDEKNVVINIGEKTFDAINHLNGLTLADTQTPAQHGQEISKRKNNVEK